MCTYSQCSTNLLMEEAVNHATLIEPWFLQHLNLRTRDLNPILPLPHWYIHTAGLSTASCSGWGQSQRTTLGTERGTLPVPEQVYSDLHQLFCWHMWTQESGSSPGRRIGYQWQFRHQNSLLSTSFLPFLLLTPVLTHKDWGTWQIHWQIAITDHCLQRWPNC